MLHSRRRSLQVSCGAVSVPFSFCLHATSVPCCFGVPSLARDLFTTPPLPSCIRGRDSLRGRLRAASRGAYGFARSRARRLSQITEHACFRAPACASQAPAGKRQKQQPPDSGSGAALLFSARPGGSAASPARALGDALRQCDVLLRKGKGVQGVCTFWADASVYRQDARRDMVGPARSHCTPHCQEIGHGRTNGEG